MTLNFISGKAFYQNYEEPNSAYYWNIKISLFPLATSQYFILFVQFVLLRFSYIRNWKLVIGAWILVSSTYPLLI